ncbi:NAD(P)/FAD-dependent oxidoreductase [Myxosarcina sp. GI1]|uniref:NAD(P)/FAD-dependent oxidoreductase n=1 Tax=Myxosarcina sp. GI1 TaxID=1541065 RepID=UPI00056B911F|nr:NAD(P)/FAD-dependent oxidoreductase [Myxosarcina sp. GI1]
MNNSIKPTIILGGGFVGLFTALHLSQQNYPAPVILIDRQERFVFKPLLYDYLTEEMNDSQVNPLYEKLLEGSGVEFIRDTVQKIDLDKKRVELANNGSIAYKYLVLALGSQTGYFGIEGAKEHTLPFRTRENAIALKNHLQNCLKRSLSIEDFQERQQLLTVIIVGAGATGVELAGTLADVLPQWYIKQGGNFEQIRLILINRGSQILSSASERLRHAAQTALQQLPVPVELEMDASVTAVRPQQVEFERNGQKQTLAAATIVWTTGTTVNPVIKSLPLADGYRDKKGRLKVLSSLQLIDRPEIFAGGDCAVSWYESLPPTAQAAYQQGAAIAQNLVSLSAERVPDIARVQIRGTTLKLGLNEAAADLFDRLLVTGKSAHLLRQGRYLTTLPTPVRDFKAATQWLSEEVLESI